MVAKPFILAVSSAEILSNLLIHWFYRIDQRATGFILS